MLYNPLSRLQRLLQSYPVRIGLFAVAWFIMITCMHYYLNSDPDQRKTIQMGYMPVITNLAAPLLDYATSHKADADFRFKAIKFASFAEMAEALRNDEIQAGFIIAPLAVVLRQQSEDVKIVYIGNRHESTLVARKDLKIRSFKALVGHTVAVPMRFSGHNLSMLQMMDEAGLQGQIKIVEMNPPDMASALAAGSLDAYFVGEPFAAQTLKANLSDLVLRVESTWPGFICNLLLVRQGFIEKDAPAVQTLVQAAVRSGFWARMNQSKAVEIASHYWGQPESLVDFALTTPENRIVFDQYIPIDKEIQKIADLMVKFGLIKNDSIDGLIDSSFARQADISGISSDINSILN